MLGGTTDWTGLATFITALGAVLTGMIASVAALVTQRNVRSPNGTTTGEQIANIAAAVSTPPGVPPLGQVASTVADAIVASGEHPVVPPESPS